MTTTRRGFLAAATLLASAASLETARAQVSATGAKQADFLFVQSANAMIWDAAGGKLTLKRVSPVTIFFTDRPERIAGNMPTSMFVPFWADGKDSFAKDNPNANLSVLDRAGVRDVVVELSRPVLTGHDLAYGVKVLEGEMPLKGGPASLFIDVIGMPLTPLSYAGVARRTAYRRAVYWRR